jgi:hypothetical protein
VNDSLFSKRYKCKVWEPKANRNWEPIAVSWFAGFHSPHQGVSSHWHGPALGRDPVPGQFDDTPWPACTTLASIRACGLGQIFLQKKEAVSRRKRLRAKKTKTITY